MAARNLCYVSPCFIVANVQASVAFYVDSLGFEVRYLGPAEDPFFAIVGREGVPIMLKAIAPDVKPVPNHTRHEWARLDAWIYAGDPDSLYKEYRDKGLAFRQPIKNDADGLRGFELEDADGYVLFFGRPWEEEPPACLQVPAASL